MNKNSTLSLWLTPLAIFLGSFVIAGGIIWSGSYSGGQVSPTQAGNVPSQNQPIAPSKTADSSKIITAGEPYIGNINAPLTIAYWYDYQCPFCSQNEKEIMPTLIDDYVSSGKVKIIFKDFPFLGPDSRDLALMSKAVWNDAPDKFYQWHKAIFSNQGREGSGWATKAKIVSVSTAILGATEANKLVALSDADTAKYQKVLDEDRAEAIAYGISSTPTFMIGKQVVVGAQPYASSIKPIIDRVLAGK